MSGSVSVVRQLLAAGLLDELHLLVHPIAVRKGMRLFDEGETPIPLKLLSSETFTTGVLNLVYGPAESPGDRPAGRYTNSGVSERRSTSASTSSTDGCPCSTRSAASSTFGSRFDVADVLRKTVRPPEHPADGEVDVGLVGQRLVPGGRGLRPRPSHGASAMPLIVCTATPRSAHTCASASKSAA